MTMRHKVCRIIETHLDEDEIKYALKEYLNKSVNSNFNTVDLDLFYDAGEFYAVARAELPDKD